MAGPGLIGPGTMFQGRFRVRNYVSYPSCPSASFEGMMTTRKTVAYAVAAIALVLGAAAAMAYGGQLGNVGPWAKTPGHSMGGMGPMMHGDQNTTCDGQGDPRAADHGSGGNRTHSANASCGGGNWTHGGG